jgi:alkylated DNA nucleotide flippase Atl1
MKLIGTDFQILVWKEIKKIPKGEVRTYKELAILISYSGKGGVKKKIELLKLEKALK